MSKVHIAIPAWIWDEPRLDLYDKAVLTNLLRYAYGNKDVVYPSQVTIADNLGIDRKKLRKVLDGLEKLKLIECVEREPGKASAYKLIFKGWGDSPRFIGWEGTEE